MNQRVIPAFPTLSPATLAAPVESQAIFNADDEGAAFLSSARAGVFHAIRQLGIREALVPSYHCGVEIEAILRAGASIEYYPVRRDTSAMVEDAIQRGGGEGRALFVVHYWGFPQEIDAIAQSCRKQGLLLIEDCAHALYSQAQGRCLGTYGDASVYSLPKSLPVPDGGVLRCEGAAGSLGPLNPAKRLVTTKATARSLLEHIRSLRHSPLAKAADAVLSMRQRVARVEDEGLGNYGETPLTGYRQEISGLSRRVLGRSSGDAIRARRRANFRHLAKRLGGLSGVSLLFDRIEDGVCPLFCPVLVENRAGLETGLRRNRIETFVFGRSLHPTLNVDDYPDARFLSRHVLGLPIHQNLDEEDMERIAEGTRAWLES